MSESVKAADFNSPRHPANYPSSIDCYYDFFGQPGEQVKIVFNAFRLKSSDSVTIGYNDVCTEDWIEVYEVFPSGREYKLGRYCASSAPGPIVSDLGVHNMRVILKTDEIGVASGFLASYTFLPETDVLGSKFYIRIRFQNIFLTLASTPFLGCGQNFTNSKNGVLSSPGYPKPYPANRQICNWYITVRPKHKVLLFFEFFLIEGDPACKFHLDIFRYSLD